MGILIDIRKIKEDTEIAYYKISTRDFGGGECYMGIVKRGGRVNFYEKNDFKEPLVIADLDKPDELIPNLPGMSTSITGRALMRAIKALRANEFPDILDYTA